jgi:ferredoxin
LTTGFQKSGQHAAAARPHAKTRHVNALSFIRTVTVGSGLDSKVSPDLLTPNGKPLGRSRASALSRSYRRWGISPRPENAAGLEAGARMLARARDDAETARHQITLSPSGEGFVAAADQTVLLSALAAGHRLPHSCRNGSCRACITMCLSGEFAYRIDWPGLLAEEKAQGWMLPCVAEPRTDLRLEIAPR